VAIDRDIQEIQALWREHMEAPFPEETAGDEIDGIDLVLADSTTAGCVDTFLRYPGHLDLWRTAILGLCHRDLHVLASRCPRPDQRAYFRRLERLAELVLKAVIARVPEDRRY
jgi:hypothetical protein